MALPNAPLHEPPNQFRQLKRALELFRRRHAPLQIQKHLPRFRRCVGGTHVLSLAVYTITAKTRKLMADG
jgi:hypothetical protein